MLNRILANITARRKPPKKVMKTTNDGQVVAASTHGELLEDYDEGPVPSYPPFQHGIPAASVRQVMETQSQLIEQIKEQLGLGPREWDRVVEPMLVRYAEIVHLLPASEAHHHRGAGGLFRHGLEAGFWACRSAENKIFTKAKTPMLRRGEGKRWEVAALTAGLTHDVGKTICDVAVIDRDGLIEWNPHQPLAQWLAEHKLRRYFLHWNSGREHKRHESFSVLFMAHIIQGTTKAYLLSHPEVMDQLLRVVSGQGEDTEFGKVVLWADRQSVSRDLKHQRISPDEFAYGVPVEKYVLDALRSLIGTKDYQPNKPPFAICVSEDGVYLKWHDIVGAILAQLRKDDIRGVPSNPDTLARLLIERGLATGRPAPTPDAPDAYYLYHELKPRAKGLAALAKHEINKYLLIHDPDMVFPSTALPQTMEVELKPVEQGRAHSLKGGERIPKDGTQSHDRPAHVLSGDAGDDSKESGDQDTAAEVSSSHAAEGTDPIDTGLDDVGSHITFEELLSGELGGAPSGAAGRNAVAEVTDQGEAHETDHSASEMGGGNSSQDAQGEHDEGNAEGPDPLGSPGFHEASEGGHDQSPDDFDLNALILEQVGPQAGAEHNAAIEHGAASMEIPDFLKTSGTSVKEQEDDDGIEYEEVEHDADEEDRPASERVPFHHGVTGNSQQSYTSDPDDGDSASKPTSRISAEQDEPILKNDDQRNQASGSDTQATGANEAQKTVSTGGQQSDRDGSSQIARVVKVLESEDATPRELLAENDLRLIKMREQEERFQKLRKKKLDKASKSTTDQFDIDSTLAAKKRGRDITLEDIRAKNSTCSELARTAKAIGVYIPGLDPDEDATVTSRKIDKEQVQLDQVDESVASGRTKKKERVDISQLLENEEDHADTLQRRESVGDNPLSDGDAAQLHAEEEKSNKGDLKGRKPVHGKTHKPDADDDSSSYDDVSVIESGKAASVSKSEIASLYNKIQKDMLDKTRSRLPDIEVTLIAESIIHAIATRAEPLGENAYISEKGRLLIRYPEGLEAHLPARPRTRDTARLAREMQQAALVSHLSGGRAHDGPVQRDPETGEMVLAFTIAINKLVQKLLKQIESRVEAGESIPHFSKLTNKDHGQYESARKEIQSSIDKQLSESMKEHDKAVTLDNEAPGDSEYVERSIERVVNGVIKAKRSALQNKEEASSAVINVIVGQIAEQNGSLIEDAPIIEKGGGISVQESIVTRAAKAANNKYVTESGIRKTIRRYGGAAQMGKSPHGVDKVVLRNSRLYIYVKGDN